MRKLLFPQLTVAVLLLIASASLTVAQQGNDTRNSKPAMALMEADNGKNIDLNTGETLRIKLKTIAGTGYSWTLSGDPAPLKLTKSYTQNNNSTARRAGGPQMSVFDLSASSPGLANVTFIYRRSWEYNVPPAKTFSVRVNVR
jgi:inhibitor of cysteine peptidase